MSLIDELCEEKKVISCFDTLGLNSDILKGLEETKLESHSTNLTFTAIPLGVNGFDLVVNGGTLLERRIAMVLVTLETFLLVERTFHAIILCHDNEQAAEIHSLIGNIGRYIEDLQLTLCTEDTIEGNEDRIISHVVIGTPKAIEVSIENSLLDTSSVNLFICDEGSTTASTEQHVIVKKLLNRLPIKTQLVFCSETLDKDFVTSLGANICLLPVNDTSSPALFNYQQYFVRCQAPALRALQMRAKSEKLNELLSDMSFNRCIVFCNYHTRCKSLNSIASEKGFKSIAVSDKPSAKFTNGANCNIVFATDDTAAKIDSSQFDLVVNYDIPDDAIKFIDRLNRNNLNTGICVNFITDDNDLKQLQKILSLIAGPKVYCTELSGFKSSVSDIIENNLNNECMGILKDFQKTKNINIRDRIIGRKTNTETVSKSKSKSNKNGKVKRNSSDNIDIESCLANILSNESAEVEDMKEHLSEMDTDSILQSLAAGNINFDTNGACEVGVTENRDGKEANTDKFDSLLNILATAHQTSETVKSNDVATGSKSLKPKEDSKEDILIKNKALLDVSKIINGTDSSDNTIEMYLNDLKGQEQEEISKIEEQDMNNILGILRNTDMNKDDDTTSTPPSEDAMIELEDIFSFGYKSIIGGENSRWKMLLAKFKPESNSEINTNSNFSDNDNSDNEPIAKSSENLVVNISAKDNGEKDDEEMSENVEIMKWVTVEKSSKKPKTTAANNSELMDHTSENLLEETLDPVNVPVNPNHENYETYENYFNDCSQHLWNNALNFSDVDQFDEWFYCNFEARLSSIRDYVQQNIYVQEMSKYQNDACYKYKS